MRVTPKRRRLILAGAVAYFILGGLLVWWLLPEGSDPMNREPLWAFLVLLLLIDRRSGRDA